MNDGIMELERWRTKDRTYPTTKIKATPAQLPHNCGKRSKANNIAVTETAVPGPRISDRTLKRKPLKMISSNNGATVIPNTANTYMAVVDDRRRSMGGSSPDVNND